MAVKFYQEPFSYRFGLAWNAIDPENSKVVKGARFFLTGELLIIVDVSTRAKCTLKRKMKGITKLIE